MDENKYMSLWRAGMAAIAGVLMVFAFVNISGTTLPDNVIRGLMIIEGIGIMVVSFTTVKVKAIRNAKRPMAKSKNRKR